MGKSRVKTGGVKFDTQAIEQLSWWHSPSASILPSVPNEKIHQNLVDGFPNIYMMMITSPVDYKPIAQTAYPITKTNCPFMPNIRPNVEKSKNGSHIPISSHFHINSLFKRYMYICIYIYRWFRYTTFHGVFFHFLLGPFRKTPRYHSVFLSAAAGGCDTPLAAAATTRGSQVGPWR